MVDSISLPIDDCLPMNEFTGRQSSIGEDMTHEMVFEGNGKAPVFKSHLMSSTLRLGNFPE
jgi:hypothetical protein